MSSGADTIDSLASLLESRYGSGPITLRTLRHGKQIYHVQRAGARDWVLRSAGVRRYVASLAYLEQHNFPAARLVRTLNGALLVEHNDRQFFVMTYVTGDDPDLSPAPLRLLGATLSRLHSLPLPLTQESPGPCGMLPAREITYARSRLDAVRDRVVPAYQARFDALVEACDRIAYLEDLPPVFLHGDCHPWNSIRTPDGEVILIDWDSAGLGPAVVDLGFLLLSCETGGIPGAVIPRDAARLDAVIEGYCLHRMPDDNELTHLPDAIRFRNLVGACASFAHQIENGLPPDEPPWWWQRHQMAGEIAERVIRAIEDLR